MSLRYAPSYFVIYLIGITQDIICATLLCLSDPTERTRLYRININLTKHLEKGFFICNFAAFRGMGNLTKFLIFHYLADMIDKTVVKKLVDEWLEDKDYFLVDIQISSDDKIVVEIDHADGVWIEDCVELSKYIEEHLSRDEADYELEVGSAGLGQPFKVPQQYENFVGKEVEVLDKDGKKIKGILKSVDGDNFIVAVNEKVQVEGKKRPIKMDVDHEYNMNEVKYTKYVISFK